MNSQTTIQNHLQLQHVLHQGIHDAPSMYILNRENLRDAEFFKQLARTDLAPGVEIQTRRGDFNVRMKCISVGAEICEWEKVRA